MSTDMLTIIFYILAIVLIAFMIIDMIIDKITMHYLNKKVNNRIDKILDDALAEAIVDNGVSKGFWIDKNYLDTANFSEVLETALHELSHKVGGDESAEFSYKLTNVNKKAIGQLLDDAQARNEIQALASIWNSL